MPKRLSALMFMLMLMIITNLSGCSTMCEIVIPDDKNNFCRDLPGP